MSEAPRVTLGTESDDGPTRRNRARIALWVLAAVLEVLGGLAIAFVIVAFTFTSDSPNAGFLGSATVRTLAQFAELGAPGVITAGFLCAAIALMVRALDFDARRRAGIVGTVPATNAQSQAEQSQAEQSHAQPTHGEPVVGPPAPIAAAQPLDHSVFMRPRTDAPPTD